MYGPHAITCLVIYLFNNNEKKNRKEKSKKRKKAHHYFLATQTELSTAEISTKNSKLRVERSCFVGNYWHTHSGQLVQFVKIKPLLQNQLKAVGFANIGNTLYSLRYYLSANKLSNNVLFLTLNLEYIMFLI